MLFDKQIAGGGARINAIPSEFPDATLSSASPDQLDAIPSFAPIPWIPAPLGDEHAEEEIQLRKTLHRPLEVLRAWGINDSTARQASRLAMDWTHAFEAVYQPLAMGRARPVTAETQSRIKQYAQMIFAADAARELQQNTRESVSADEPPSCVAWRFAAFDWFEQAHAVLLHYPIHERFADPVAVAALMLGAVRAHEIFSRDVWDNGQVRNVIPVAPGLHVEVMHGGGESAAGFDFALKCKCEGHVFYAARVGVVRSEQGYDLLKIQGGHDLGKLRMDLPNGTSRHMMGYLQEIFGQDHLTGYARWVMEEVSKSAPGATWRALPGPLVSSFVINLCRAEGARTAVAGYYDDPSPDSDAFIRRCESALKRLESHLGKMQDERIQMNLMDVTVPALRAAMRGAPRHDARLASLGFKALPNQRWLIRP